MDTDEVQELPSEQASVARGRSDNGDEPDPKRGQHHSHDLPSGLTASA
jgi:hypothetical protein